MRGCELGDKTNLRDDRRRCRGCVPDWRITIPLAHACPRCGARTRRGTPCQAPAMPTGRCRLHGGTSTGPRTAKGLERLRKAKTTNGLRTAEREQVRKMIRDLKVGAKRLVVLV
jgi:hypothetical protein